MSTVLCEGVLQQLRVYLRVDLALLKHWGGNGSANECEDGCELHIDVKGFEECTGRLVWKLKSK